MTETVNTLDRFCRDLLYEHHEGRRHDPETIAARFVERFHVSARPALAELRTLLKEAGVGEVSELAIDGAPKGLHVGVLGQECHIFYKEELWQGARDYTVLHETYEIMHETLCHLATGTQPVEEVCRQADRFAAGVLMQPGEFQDLALASGLDVMALQREYGYAYAAVALRLAEVVRGLPYFVALYERPGRLDPARWPRGNDLTALRATVVRRTNGMGPPASGLVMGIRGGIPQRHRRVPAGSLAELAARSGQREYTEADGLAAVATPVHWKGRLAKLAVVAVPLTHRDALAPQLGYRREPSRQLPARPRLAALDGMGRTADNNSKTNAYHSGQKKIDHAAAPDFQDHHLLAAARDVRARAAGEAGRGPRHERAGARSPAPVHGGPGTAPGAAPGKTALPTYLTSG